MEQASLEIVIQRMLGGFGDEFVAKVVRQIKEHALKTGVEPLDLLRDSAGFLKPMIFDVTGLQK
jgi:hypothetical protein